MEYVFGLAALFAWLVWLNLKWIRKGKARHRSRDSPDFLDRTVFDNSGVNFTARDACQGILCLGQVGSGKTTGVMATLIDSLLGMGCGCLYVCAKPDDRERMLRACKKAGRMKDVILVDKHAKERLSFFSTLLRVDTDYATLAQIGAAGFDVFAQVSGNNQQGWGNDGRFWGEAQTRLIRSTLLLLLLAKIDVTPGNILKVVQTLPKTDDHAATDEWKQSFCGRCMHEAFLNARAENLEAEFDAVSDYFIVEIASLGLKTRSNIVAMVTGTADSLTKGLASRVFGTDSTFDLAEAIAEDRIVIVDLPYGEWGEVGRFCGAGFKYLAQREILKRRVTKGTKVWPIISDEYQNIMTEGDWGFASMSRSFRGPLWIASQGIESMYAALGGEQHKAKVETLVGNLGANFVCLPTYDTAKWVTEKLGKRKQRFRNASGGTSGGPVTPGDFFFGSDKTQVSANAGFSESFELMIQPNQLARLATGGPRFGWVVTALFIQPGRGEPYYWLNFSQGELG